MARSLIVAGYNNYNLGDDLMFASVVNRTDYKGVYFYGPEIKPYFVNSDINFIPYGRSNLIKWKFFADFAYIGGSLFMGENDNQFKMFDKKLSY